MATGGQKDAWTIDLSGESCGPALVDSVVEGSKHYPKRLSKASSNKQVKSSPSKALSATRNRSVRKSSTSSGGHKKNNSNGCNDGAKRSPKHQGISRDHEVMQTLNAQRVLKQEELQKLRYELNNLQRERELLNTRIKNLETRRNACEDELRDIQLQTHGAQISRKWDSEDFDHSTEVRNILQNQFGHNNFRSLQLCAINATLSGVDTFVVMPTGAGKSLIYQVPAVFEARKLTVVVSPLLSLSRDQVMSLQKRNVAAAMLCGETSREDARETLHAIRNLQLRLVYVTPEKITKSKQFMSVLEQLYGRDSLGRFVIDEAHCCSTMGHDFRPDYQKLHILKQRFPQTPILAVTATATASVEKSVCETLLGTTASARHSWIRFRTTFNRSNLIYEVLEKSSAATEHTTALADMIKSRFPKQCGIVYCFSRKDTEDTAKALMELGLKAAPYHAELDSATKQRIHYEWSTYAAGHPGTGQIQLICATSAFGMGIDKPDVRFVVHLSMPKNMEAYCQESGRAGRDGKDAHCILFYRRPDVLRVSALVSDARNGGEKLIEIVRYCENEVYCRRKFMAEVFGEPFDKNKLCKGKCDVCARSSSAQKVNFEVVDFTSHAKSLLKTLQSLLRGGSKSVNITMTKLLQTWRKEFKPRTSSNKAWSVTQAEQLCMQLLMSHIFKIKWRSSGYKTNAYLEPGVYASSLASNSGQVKYHIPLDNAEKRYISDQECLAPETPGSTKQSKTKTISRRTKNSSSQKRPRANSESADSFLSSSVESDGGSNALQASQSSFAATGSTPRDESGQQSYSSGAKTRCQKKPRPSFPPGPVILSLDSSSEEEDNDPEFADDDDKFYSPIASKHSTSSENVSAKETILAAFDAGADYPDTKSNRMSLEGASSTSASKQNQSISSPQFNLIGIDGDDEKDASSKQTVPNDTPPPKGNSQHETNCDKHSSNHSEIPSFALLNDEDDEDEDVDNGKNRHHNILLETDHQSELDQNTFNKERCNAQYPSQNSLPNADPCKSKTMETMGSEKFVRSREVSPKTIKIRNVSDDDDSDFDF